MSSADQIQAEFPSGVVMPSALRELCDYVDGTDYPISGFMELRPMGEALKYWLSPDFQARDALAGFGAGPDGSILALWLHAGTDASKAPVVHMGSEGDQLRVLANDIAEFLLLFGIGYNELGFDDLSEPPEEPESAEALRKWLSKKFGLKSPKVGQPIVDKARANHPDFEAWMERMQGDG